MGGVIGFFLKETIFNLDYNLKKKLPIYFNSQMYAYCQTNIGHNSYM